LRAAAPRRIDRSYQFACSRIGTPEPDGERRWGCARRKIEIYHTDTRGDARYPTFGARRRWTTPPGARGGCDMGRFRGARSGREGRLEGITESRRNGDFCSDDETLLLAHPMNSRSRRAIARGRCSLAGQYRAWSDSTCRRRDPDSTHRPSSEDRKSESYGVSARASTSVRKPCRYRGAERKYDSSEDVSWVSYAPGACPPDAPSLRSTSRISPSSGSSQTCFGVPHTTPASRALAALALFAPPRPSGTSRAITAVITLAAFAALAFRLLHP
jgi:hypothetical protein